jgi:hypothetical protein
VLYEGLKARGLLSRAGVEFKRELESTSARAMYTCKVGFHPQYNGKPFKI